MLRAYHQVDEGIPDARIASAEIQLPYKTQRQLLYVSSQVFLIDFFDACETQHLSYDFVNTFCYENIYDLHDTPCLFNSFNTISSYFLSRADFFRHVFNEVVLYRPW